MKPVDMIVLAVIAVILTVVILYIRKQKKKGVHCIGCPDSAKCTGNCGHCNGNCCGCNRSEQV